MNDKVNDSVVVTKIEEGLQNATIVENEGEARGAIHCSDGITKITDPKILASVLEQYKTMPDASTSNVDKGGSVKFPKVSAEIVENTQGTGHAIGNDIDLIGGEKIFEVEHVKVNDDTPPLHAECAAAMDKGDAPRR